MKLWARVGCLVFLTHGVVSVSSVVNKNCDFNAWGGRGETTGWLGGASTAKHLE